MTEQQAADMLASLVRIESLLIHIANNTADATGGAGSGRARTIFFPHGAPVGNPNNGGLLPANPTNTR